MLLWSILFLVLSAVFGALAFGDAGRRFGPLLDIAFLVCVGCFLWTFIRFVLTRAHAAIRAEIGAVAGPGGNAESNGALAPNETRFTPDSSSLQRGARNSGRIKSTARPRATRPPTPTDTEIAMNAEQVKGKWKQVKGKAQERWGKLTDDDLDVIDGRSEQLVGKIQERYGKTREEAKREVDEFLAQC